MTTTTVLTPYKSVQLWVPAGASLQPTQVPRDWEPTAGPLCSAVDGGRSLAGVKISPTRGIVARYCGCQTLAVPGESKKNSNPYDASKRTPSSERGQYRVTQRLTALRRKIDNRLALKTVTSSACVSVYRYEAGVTSSSRDLQSWSLDLCSMVLCFLQPSLLHYTVFFEVSALRSYALFFSSRLCVDTEYMLRTHRAMARQVTTYTGSHRSIARHSSLQRVLHAPCWRIHRRHPCSVRDRLMSHTEPLQWQTIDL
jgi:hypothetical protein